MKLTHQAAWPPGQGPAATRSEGPALRLMLCCVVLKSLIIFKQGTVLVSSSCCDKVPQTGTLNGRHSLSPNSGGLEACDQGLSPGCVDGHLLPVSSQGRPSKRVCVLISSSYKDTIPMGSGPTPVTSFYLNLLFKRPHLQI